MIFEDLEFSGKSIKKRALKEEGDSICSFDFSIEKMHSMKITNEIFEDFVEKNSKIILENEEFDLSKKCNFSVQLKLQKSCKIDKILITYIKIEAQEMILNQYEGLYILYVIERLYELKNNLDFYEITLDSKAIKDLINLKKTLFKKSFGLKLDSGSEKFLLLSKSGEIDFDIGLLHNKRNEANDLDEHQFKWIFQDCYLYHYIKENYIKISNPFDIEIKYIKQSSNMKLSKLMIYIKPLKILTDEICLRNFINFVDEFKLSSSTKGLTFICKPQFL